MTDAVFLDEQQLLLQPQPTPQTDAPVKPDLDLMTQGQANTPGQFAHGDAPNREPASVALPVSGSVEV